MYPEQHRLLGADMELRSRPDPPTCSTTRTAQPSSPRLDWYGRSHVRTWKGLRSSASTSMPVAALLRRLLRVHFASGCDERVDRRVCSATVAAADGDEPLGRYRADFVPRQVRHQILKGHGRPPSPSPARVSRGCTTSSALHLADWCSLRWGPTMAVLRAVAGRLGRAPRSSARPLRSPRLRPRPGTRAGAGMLFAALSTSDPRAGGPR